MAGARPLPGGGRVMSSPKKSAAAVPLSIVIPAIGDTAALEDTLVSVLENRPDDCEVVVPLGCPYDDPWGIRDEVRFVQAPVGSGLVTCTNLGIASSAGSVVHVLAAGWRAAQALPVRLDQLALFLVAAVASGPKASQHSGSPRPR